MLQARGGSCAWPGSGDRGARCSASTCSASWLRVAARPAASASSASRSRRRIGHGGRHERDRQPPGQRCSGSEDLDGVFLHAARLGAGGPRRVSSRSIAARRSGWSANPARGKSVTCAVGHAAPPAPGGASSAATSSSRARPPRLSTRTRDAAASAATDRDGLPGPDDVAQPGAHASASRSREALRHTSACRAPRRARPRRRATRSTSASPTPRGGSTATRTSSPAACASA